MHLDTDLFSTFSTVILGSEITRQSSFINTTPQALPDETDAPVVLSDLQYVGRKRRMLNSVNRPRATDMSSTAILGSEIVRQPSFIDTTTQALPDETDAPVGLSDPQYVGQKRRMLDSVNRLRATG